MEVEPALPIKKNTPSANWELSTTERIGNRKYKKRAHKDKQGNDLKQIPNVIFVCEQMDARSMFSRQLVRMASVQ